MQVIFSKIYFKFGIMFFLLFSTLISVSGLASEPELRRLNFRIGKYKDYLIKFVEGEAPSGCLNELLITRKDQELFTKVGVNSIRSGADLKLIEDLNNITSPILIVADYSGGAHCCYSTTILKLDQNFKRLAEFEGGHSEVKVKKLQGADSFRIELNDWNYAYKWTSFADSYAPKIVLYLVQDKVYVAYKEMKEKPLSSQKIKYIIQDINSIDYLNFKYSSEAKEYEQYFSKLLKPILELIYSGNTKQAQQIIEQTWPGDKDSKEHFISDMKQTLRESRYYNDIVELNKPYPLLEAK